MTTIKCRKCGKVYPFNEKICPDCGYDIRKDETLSPRDRVALGLKSDSALFKELGKENTMLFLTVIFVVAVFLAKYLA